MAAFKKRTRAEKRAMAKAKERRQSKNKEGIRRLRQEARGMMLGQFTSDFLHTMLTSLTPAQKEKVHQVVRRMVRTELMQHYPKDN